MLTTTKTWTVLAYIVADDDRDPPLNGYAEQELTALQAAAAAREIDIYTHVDYTDGQPKRCVFRSGKREVLECKRLPESNAGTAATLIDFFESVRLDLDGADTRLAVVFWGHGKGPAGLFLDPAPSTTTPQTLKLPELKRAFARLGRPYVDLLLFKDCWISTLEAAYELRDVARFLVGSQGLVPIKTAWPYGEIFGALQSKSVLDRQTLDTVIEGLRKHYLDDTNLEDGREVPFSALDLDAAAGVSAPLGFLATAMLGAEGELWDQSRSALENALGGDPALIDVKTMCNHLQENKVFTREAFELERAINALVLGHTPSPQNLRGVSLFRRPTGKRLDDSMFATSLSWRTYDDLALSATGWSSIAFENRTQRV